MIRKVLLLVTVALVQLLNFSCTSNESKEKVEPKVEESIEAVPESSTDVDLNVIMGKFQPEKRPEFVQIDTMYADRAGMYLQKEAYDSFIKMFDAAKKDGVHLVIRSATRNFFRQKAIWEDKWTGRRLVDDGENLSESTPDHAERAMKILRWSSMPGTSRHHWGTDIDLNAFENAYFETGVGKEVYDWLQANAATYGYCQPYTPKGDERPHGYNEERWHWSYTPISTQYLIAAKKSLTNDDFSGFLGSDVADRIDVKQKYILGVSQKCTE